MIHALEQSPALSQPLPPLARDLKCEPVSTRTPGKSGTIKISCTVKNQRASRGRAVAAPSEFVQYLFCPRAFGVERQLEHATVTHGRELPGSRAIDVSFAIENHPGLRIATIFSREGVEQNEFPATPARLELENGSEAVGTTDISCAIQIPSRV